MFTHRIFGSSPTKVWKQTGPGVRGYSKGTAFWFAIALLFAGPGCLEAQDTPRGAAVRALNSRVLQVHAQLLESTPSQAVGLRNQAAAALEERAAALEALIETSPALALSMGFSPDLASRLAEAFPQSAQHLESYGKWRGTMEYLIFDDPAMRGHRSLRKIKAGQTTLEVYFAGNEPAGLKCGSIVEVSGMKSGQKVAVAESVVTGSEINALSCSPTGVQRAAVLMVTFPGAGIPNISAQTMYNYFFAPSGRSLNNFWQETSYNQASVTGDVFGWYTLPTSYTCDQYGQIQAAAIAAADPYVNFQNYNRIFYVFPSLTSCSYAGLSSVGCNSVSTADGIVNASTTWLISNYTTSTDQTVKLLSHEGGHALGLLHSRSRDFGTETLGAVGASGTIDEYGDNFSTMGYWNLGHYTAEQKVQLGWLPVQKVQTVQSGGVYTVAPLETNAAGVQALQVQRGTNNAWLWLEYRQPLGNYDTTLGSQVYSGALAHYHDSTTGSSTDLLDYTPATSSWTDPALAAGRSWTDPYSSLSLSVQSVNSGGMTVAVNYGAVVCTPANPTVTISPANPSVAAGSSVNYTVSVTNNDSTSCTAGLFTLSATQPGGWAWSLGSSSLSVSPGQSASTTLTETPPSGTTAGTYAISVTALKASNSGTGNANCTVTGPLPSLTVSQSIGGQVSPVVPVYRTGATVPISATVRSGQNPASGATVTFTLTKPDNSTTRKTVVANTSGVATWSYKVSPKGPVGTYTSSAQATYNNQSAASGPASFTVQ